VSPLQDRVSARRGDAHAQEVAARVSQRRAGSCISDPGRRGAASEPDLAVRPASDAEACRDHAPAPHMHKLRHTFCSALLASGTTPHGGAEAFRTRTAQHAPGRVPALHPEREDKRQRTLRRQGLRLAVKSLSSVQGCPKYFHLARPDATSAGKNPLIFLGPDRVRWR
jgi:hypothetical protein